VLDFKVTRVAFSTATANDLSTFSLDPSEVFSIFQFVAQIKFGPLAKETGMIIIFCNSATSHIKTFFFTFPSKKISRCRKKVEPFL
jgi:hypothetical protein